MQKNTNIYFRKNVYNSGKCSMTREKYIGKGVTLVKFKSGVFSKI